MLATHPKPALSNRAATPGSAVGDAEYGETSYVYDALSRTILMTDQQGDTQTHDYDLASRLLRKDYRTAANSPEGANIADSDVFTYDNASRRITATSERYNNVCSMEYDDASRVISESLKVNVDQANETTFVTRNEYDEANRLIKQTYPDLSVVDRRYTVRNQLKEIDWNGTANIHTRTYDDGMRLKTTTHGNDVVSTLNYRGDESPEGEQPKDNQLSQISTSTGPNGVGNYNYDYDPNKNKSFENITGPLAGFGFGGTGSNGSATVYDADDRLTTWGRSDGALDRDWDLSLVGRWNSLTENDGTSDVLKELTHSDAHEITSFGGAAVEHDTKGNRTLDQHGRSFTWDFDNRLQAATVPEGSPEGEPGTHAYTYDAMGRRVSKTTGGELTIFVCSGSQVVCEYDVAVGATPDPASPNQRYVYGSYVDEVILKDGEFTDDAVSGIVYYHRNQQYSIIALTDESGDVVERYAYTAYGQMTVLDELGVELESGTAFANPYTYTARRFDEELGLMYFRARYYDPSTGEFISRDPLGYVDGMSQYRAYFVPGGADPSGELLVKVKCNIGNKLEEVGELEATGLFFHDTRGGNIDGENNGIGIAIHFRETNKNNCCNCDSYKILQIVKTNYRSSTRLAGTYLDGARQASPFYSDNALNTQGANQPIPRGYPGHGLDNQGNPNTVSSTVSIYDRPFRSTSALKRDLASRKFEWQALTYVFCIRNNDLDEQLSLGISYGFERQWDNTNSKHDSPIGLGPVAAAKDNVSIGLSWGGVGFDEFKAAVNADTNYQFGSQWESP